MKLEPNMYVRTKDGYICKILRETYSKYLSRNKELCYEVDRPINTNMELYVGDILKASHNIIDLIEVGDYVNGWRITTIDRRNNKLYAEDEDGYLIRTISKKNIKSIVTKEMFSSMEYRLGENKDE